MVNLLIPYIVSLDHPDPLLEEFTYGDVDQRATKLKRDLQKGDFVFFHTTPRGVHLITLSILHSHDPAPDLWSLENIRRDKASCGGPVSLIEP